MPTTPNAPPFSVAELALVGITPEAIAITAAWGLGVVLASWAIGYVVGIAVGLIRQI